MIKTQQKKKKQYNISYPVTFPVYINSSTAFRIYKTYIVGFFFIFLFRNFIMFSILPHLSVELIVFYFLCSVYIYESLMLSSFCVKKIY